MEIIEFIELNKNRAMKTALKKEGCRIVEDADLVCLDAYTFLRKLYNDYCAINFDPISKETKHVTLPAAVISDEVKAIFPPTNQDSE